MRSVIALESRLRGCSNVTTLGVRPAFSDYSQTEKSLILNAKVIYYPSDFYVHIFNAMGKCTFPGPATYIFAQDKIRQTALFQVLGIPHPKTRVYYGKKQQQKILEKFSFPLVAKIPRGSALGAGVFLIENKNALADYCSRVHAAYIQEYLKIDRDIRVVVIGKKVALAYWRVAPSGGFLNNVAAGAKIVFDPVLARVTDLAVKTATQCKWDDVGLDLCVVDGQPLVLEANMKYGRQGFEKAGIDYLRMMEKLIADDII